MRNIFKTKEDKYLGIIIYTLIIDECGDGGTSTNHRQMLAVKHQTRKVRGRLGGSPAQLVNPVPPIHPCCPSRTTRS
ncbi:hypothetical protein H1P_1340006 [Hyella patelloides LEGE 07179]|uniref:Uncharacterized protein n=1 Tax=Hyella patelloides LEGE 07179 TaxID=945734 RepID=A0A563VKX0_9CYAN|nr:hypothetical protein H1P_1340006 [Hyella patelloides LEGE 07179]